METPEKDIRLIERFLDSELSADELSVFEQRFKDDDKFRRMVEQFNEVHLITEEMDPVGINPRDFMRGADDIPSKSNHMLKYILGLLALVVLIAALVYGFFDNQKEDSNVIYAEIDSYVESNYTNIMRGEVSAETFIPYQNELGTIDSLSELGQTDVALTMIQNMSDTLSDANLKELLHWKAVGLYLELEDYDGVRNELENIQKDARFKSNQKAGKFLDRL